MLDFLLVELPCDFKRSAFGKREEILLRLVFCHHGEQFGPVTTCAKEHLALAILHEFLNIENHFFRNAEIFHVFGQSDTELFAKVKEVLDRIA